MKQWLPVVIAVGAAAAAVVFAVLYFTEDAEPETVAVQPCGDRTFGHIRSLVRRGDHYELRFDPAWFTSGETANTAAAEDGQVAPGAPVPNDNYVVDESDRTLKYLISPGAHVTVLVSSDTGILTAPITVEELAEIVSTGKSSRRELFEPLESGVWIRTRIDSVCALDQQYRP